MSCPMPPIATPSSPRTSSNRTLSKTGRAYDRPSGGQQRPTRGTGRQKAMLHRECGTVAIIVEEDMGDGRISSALGKNCRHRFRAKCGNDDARDGSLPSACRGRYSGPDKNSKECPNCKNRMQKNGGCDLMTCQPQGGCGYEFWWTCGCPYRSHLHGR